MLTFSLVTTYQWRSAILQWSYCSLAQSHSYELFININVFPQIWTNRYLLQHHVWFDDALQCGIYDFCFLWNSKKHISFKSIVKHLAWSDKGLVFCPSMHAIHDTCMSGSFTVIMFPLHSTSQEICTCLLCCVLTHWGWVKMAAISQTTVSSAFSWMKTFEFQIKFHWSLFLMDQLTIFQHWFR